MAFSGEEDISLLAAVSEGSETAFKTLLHRYHSQVYCFVSDLGGTPEDAEEIVQDVFMKLWTNRSQLRQVQHFSAYLFTMARNQAYSAFRKSVRAALLFRQWEERQLASPAPTADTDQYQLLDAVIDRLPQRQREIYLLHRHERLRYAEIAERLHIGRETVKSHLSAAVRFIKTQLGSGALLLLFFFRH